MYQADSETLTSTTITSNSSSNTRRYIPVTLAHSYLDHSPVITQGNLEMTDERAPVTCTLGRNETLSNTSRFTSKGSTMLSTPNTLSSDDISRVRSEELGKQVVAGSPQSRLISGRWRHCAKPVEGDPIYTDYYGPVGGGSNNADYYGRSYHFGDTRNGLRSNKLVEDTAYGRVQASMQGIHSLRYRPGLAIQTQIVHTNDDKNKTQGATAPKPHTLTSYHRVH